MEAMKPYIKTGQGWHSEPPIHVSPRKIAGTDWTVLQVSSLES